MKIGINTLFLIPGEVGGSETYLFQTLRALLALDPALETVLFTTASNEAALRDAFGTAPGTTFVNLPFDARCRPVRIVREQTDLPRLARRHAVDVLWSPGYTAPLGYRGPQAVTIYDMQYKTFPHDLSPAARLASDVLIRGAARRCKAILTLSHFSRTEILRFTRARPGSVHVTPLGVDPAFAAPAPPEVLRRRTAELTGADGPFLLSVANTYPHKQVALLVRAFGRLAAAIPHRLVLLGRPGLDEENVRRACRELPPDRVVRLERVCDADLRLLYQGAAAMVFPSAYEGFGLPLIEAMMAGTPVIARALTAVPEATGEHARLFDGTEEGLARAIQDELRDRPGAAPRLAAAQRHAAAFTWHRTAELTLAALRAAVAEPRDPAALRAEEAPR